MANTPKNPKQEPEAVEVEAVEAEAVEAEAVETEAEAAAEAPKFSGLDDEQKQFFREIPSYQDARKRYEQATSEGNKAGAEEAKALMTAIQEKASEIDLDDTTTIIDFGSHALDEINKISENIVSKQKENGIYSVDLSSITADIKDLNLDSIGGLLDKVKEAGTNFIPKSANELKAAGAGATAGAIAGSALPVLGTAIGFVGGGLISMFGARKMAKKKSQETLEQSEEYLIAALSSTDVKAKELKKKLERIRTQIKPGLVSIQQLGAAQAGAYKELSLYISAGEEILNRIKDDKLPAAQAEFEKTKGSQSAREALQELQDTNEILNERVEALITERAASFMSVSILRDQKRFYTRISSMINTALQQTTSQWNRMQASAGMTIELTKATKVIEDVKDHSGNMIRQNTTLHAMTSERMNDLSKRGSIDPDEMVNAFKTLQGVYDKAFTEVADLNSTRDKILGAQAELASSIQKASNRQTNLMLGYQPSNTLQIEDSSSSKKSSKATFNDGAKGDTAAPAADRKAQPAPKKPKGFEL